MSGSDIPVVISRKDARIRHPWVHAFAFAVTGGVSGVVTAAEAASHASYNERTAVMAGTRVSKAEFKEIMAASAEKSRVARAACRAERAARKGARRAVGT